MAMDGHLSARLQRVQHALRGIFRCRSQVEVLPQSVGALCLIVQGREQIGVYKLDVHCCYFLSDARYSSCR